MSYFNNISDALCFDDVLLVPQYSDIRSRKSNELDISTKIKNHVYNLPIISAPMDKVYSTEMSKTLSHYGGICLIHRYNTISEQVQEFKNSLYQSLQRKYNVGCAVGVTGDYLERVQELWSVGCRIFCIDVAHGHHILVKECVKNIKNSLNFDSNPDAYIIAGNVATGKAYKDLIDWGVDVVRCGVGGSGVCTTRVKTGHGVPTLWTIFDCAKMKKHVGGVLIGDGGFRDTGDIIKGLAAGADMIMLGGMLAGTSDSPGEICEIDGTKYKPYRGMASKEAQVDWKGNYNSNEGIVGHVKYSGETFKKLEEIKHNILTGLSYSGCKNLNQFQNNSKFIKQTSSGHIEGTPHIHRGT